MDEYPTKKVVSDGLRVSRRGSNIPLGDGNHMPRNSQCCNRLGCSINSMSGGQIGLQERSKLSRPNYRASSSKAVPGSSSRQVSSSTALRKAHRRPQTPPSSKEIYVASSSKTQGFTESLDSSTSEEQSVTSEREEMEDTASGESSLVLQNTLSEVCNRSVMHTSRVRKRVYQRSNSSSHSFPRGSSSNKETIFHHSLSSRHSEEPSEVPSHGPGGHSSRYGLGNLSCTSVSDVLPPRFSVADTQGSGRVRKSDGENSSIRGKGISNASALATSSSKKSTIGRNVSFTSSPLSLQPTRRNIRSSTTRGVTSVRTRRMLGEGVNTRLTGNSTNNNSISLSDSNLPPSQSQLELLSSSSISTSSSSSSPTSMDLPPFVQLNSFRRSGSGNEISRARTGFDHEGSSANGFRGPSMDHGGYPRMNMEGIAEVLFALERIEQDEEITYEQLLVLETNLFLGGLSFHDQHRDMRMDIDNMTYEELLALEERMGSVSTALSEEALSKCLHHAIYTSRPPVAGMKVSEDDDVKCSICQEEYVNGDEIGSLQCDHCYHVSCIQVWLRLKNWCPICKAPAAPE
ncbi:unnamed protein product [Victoria cruziana]